MQVFAPSFSSDFVLGYQDLNESRIRLQEEDKLHVIFIEKNLSIIQDVEHCPPIAALALHG